MDSILQALGPTGRYQMLQMIVSISPTLAAAIQLLGNVFICKDVPHHCTPPATDSDFFSRFSNYTDVSYKYGECSIAVFSNGSQLEHTPCVFGNSYSLPVSSSVVSEFDLVCEDAYLAKLSQTLVIVGQGFGAVLITIVSDRLGRRPVLIAANLGLLVCGLVVAYAPNFLVFAIFKFIIGGFQQGVLTGNYTYNAELFNRDSRRLNAVINKLFWALGVMLLPLISYLCKDLSWRSLQTVYCTLNITILLQIALMDESIRWLLANGKPNKAFKLIKKAARMNNVQLEKVMDASAGSTVSSAKEASSPSETNLTAVVLKKMTLLDILRIKRMLLNALTIWFAWFTVAISFFTIYLTSPNLAGDAYLNFFLISTMEIPPCFFLYFSFNRYGRRITTAVFFLLVAMGLLTRGIFEALTPDPVYDVIILIATMVAMAGASGSFGCVFAYTPEMFPTNVRNQALGLSSCVCRIGGMLAPFTAVLAAAAAWAPGVLIGGMAIVVCVLMVFLPETYGRELPQTVEDLQRWYRAESPGDSSRTQTETGLLMKEKD